MRPTQFIILVSFLFLAEQSAFCDRADCLQKCADDRNAAGQSNSKKLYTCNVAADQMVYQCESEAQFLYDYGVYDSEEYDDALIECDDEYSFRLDSCSADYASAEEAAQNTYLVCIYACPAE